MRSLPLLFNAAAPANDNSMRDNWLAAIGIADPDQIVDFDRWCGTCAASHNQAQFLRPDFSANAVDYVGQATASGTWTISRTR
ncbi:MAG: hypothetical protein ACRD8O_21255 [Bryobacteraceae bacterium]